MGNNKSSTKAQAYIEAQLNENGFIIKEKTELPHRTRLRIEKGGIEDVVELPDTICDGSSYVALFLRAFNLYTMIQNNA